MNDKTSDLMTKAIISLMRQTPFYSSIILNLKKVRSNDPDMYMATDGSKLIYNEDNLINNPTQSIIEILKHEAMHVANKHHIRMKKLKIKYKTSIEKHNVDFLKAFNVAADMAINSILKKHGNYYSYSSVWTKAEILKSACFPEDYGLEEMQSTEFYLHEILKMLDKALEKSEESRDKVIKELGLNEIKVTVLEADPTMSESDLNQTVDKMIAKAGVLSAGNNNSDGSSYFIDKLRESDTVNWKTELNVFIKKSTKGKPSYLKPNRRFDFDDFIFPSDRIRETNDIVLLVDTSGSMSDEAVSTVYKHMSDMIKANDSLNINLIPFDNEVFVKHSKVYNKSTPPLEDEDKSRYGNGGTEYTGAVEHALSLNPQGIIMLTDLMPYDLNEFLNLKISIPFIMLSTYQHEWCGGKEGKDAAADRRKMFPKKKIIEVTVDS